MRRALAALALTLAACGPAEPAGSGPVSVPAGIDHAEWTRLLGEYVDERGLVDYGRWKASDRDRRALAGYLARFAPEPRPAASGPDQAASLINAYNALTVDWILRNYPTRSIRALDDSFGAARHAVGGRKVSLDAIEHGTLRPRVGFRVHAALVCAARSCPPLRREAFAPETLDAQLDDAMRAWLAREDLNRFSPAEGRAQVSEIFKWFGEDFEKAGGVREVLRRYGPPAAREALGRPDARIGHLDYDWTLNDQKPVAYGGIRSLWDRVRDRLF